MFCTAVPAHGLQPVAEVYDNRQLPGMTAMSVRLACGCDRNASVNTKKPSKYDDLHDEVVLRDQD